MTFSHFDQVWNRAGGPASAARRPGDQALTAIVGCHSLVMSGGFEHSLEVDYAQTVRAGEAFQMFGANKVAAIVESACRVGSLLEKTAQISEEQAEQLQELDRRYDEQIPTDSRLMDVARGYFTEHPEQFESATEV